MFIFVSNLYRQAKKIEDLGPINFQEEIKNRVKMVYVPNWFNVDLKTGVSEVYMKTKLLITKNRADVDHSFGSR